MTMMIPDLTGAVPAEDVVAEEETAQLYGIRRVFDRFKHQKLAVAAAVVVGIGILLAIIGPWIAPYGLEDTVTSFNAPPSAGHWLGTDSIGHDELSLLLYAMRASIFAAGFAAILGAAVGTAIGLLSGYIGKYVDWGIMRLIDAQLSFPGLLLIVALVGVMGNGLYHAMIALAISFVPGFARLIRGEVLAARERNFVAAARVTGVSKRRIVRKHIVPTILPQFIVQFCLTLGFALVAEGALGYLGLGAQPPATSLGEMLQNGFTQINVTVRLILIPGLAITILATSLNVIADGLRDALGRGGDVSGILTAPRA
jgi:ABC-type dipeptide/oligopeptide/nickel transport system permease subunit